MPFAGDVLESTIDADGFAVSGLPQPAVPSGAARLADLAFGIATVADLAALDVTNLGTGTIRRCADLRRWFFLDKVTTRTAIAGAVVAAAGAAGWWVAIDSSEPSWLAQTTWTVDPASGSDTSPTTTVRTFAELDRRLYGYRGSPGQTTTITIANDVPAADAHTLRNVRVGAEGGSFRILGTRTQVGHYTITTWTPLSTSTNTTFRVAATGIGTNGNDVAESMISHLAVRTSGGGAASAWIQFNVSANEVRVSEPTSADAATNDRGSATTFANGDTLAVYRLTKLPFWPFSTEHTQPVLGNIYLSNGTVDGVVPTAGIGTSSPRLIQCVVDSWTIRGGHSGLVKGATDKGVFASVNFTGACEFICNSSTLRSPSFVDCSVALNSDSTWITNGTMTMQKTSFNLNDSSLGIGGSLSSFDSDDVLSGLNVGTFVTSNASVRLGGLGTTSVLVGSGNTRYLMYGQIGTKNMLHVAANSWTTSEAHQLWLSGVEYDFPDIVSGLTVDLTTLSCIADHE